MTSKKAAIQPKELNTDIKGGIPKGDFVYFILFSILASHLGWLVENTFRLITIGIIDSRFHILPFISPYGMVALFFCILIGSPDRISPLGHPIFSEDNRRYRIISNIIAYLSICLTVFVGELIVGNLWDIAFGVELWDYSGMPLHVTQYTGAISALGFGTGAYLIFKYLYKYIIGFLKKHIKERTALIISLAVGIPLLLDTLYLMFSIIVFREATIWWSVKVW